MISERKLLLESSNDPNSDSSPFQCLQLSFYFQTIFLSTPSYEFSCFQFYSLFLFAITKKWGCPFLWGLQVGSGKAMTSFWETTTPTFADNCHTALHSHCPGTLEDTTKDTLAEASRGIDWYCLTMWRWWEPEAFSVIFPSKPFVLTVDLCFSFVSIETFGKPLSALYRGLTWVGTLLCHFLKWHLYHQVTVASSTKATFTDCFYQCQYFLEESSIAQITELVGEESNKVMHSCLVGRGLICCSLCKRQQLWVL